MKIYLLDASAAQNFSKEKYPYRTVGVFLRHSSLKERSPRLFRCNNCGRILFEYGSDDLVFIFDDMPLIDSETALDIKCHCCKINYRIMC